MDRLTVVVGGEVVPTLYAHDFIFVMVDADYDGYCKTLERLNAYEDTGLMPDEVEAMKVAMMGKSVAEVKEFCGIPIEKMVEIAEAYRTGRCLCSQYPIGATVYRLNRASKLETKFIDGERYFRDVRKWGVVKCVYTWVDAAADSENPGFRKFFLNEQDAIRERDELNRKEAEVAIGGGQK